MNILIAPDSFKETMNAKEVCKHISIGLKKVLKNVSIISVPMADGGEGTVQALVDSCGGKIIKTEVLDPLQREIESYYGILNDNTAVIEMATASGLELLGENEKNPMQTTSYGFGQLIEDALNKGVKKFILGLGGSATNDAGIGMLQALGVKFYDCNNKEVEIGAQFLNQIVSFDTTNLNIKFKDVKIEVACDVKNILCGTTGASYTFAKQKGGDLKMIKTLDEYLFNFSTICKKIYKIDNKNIKGAGAAGGLGFALITFLNAELKSGIEIVIKKTNLEEKIKATNLIITGEGKMDSQTIFGKTPIGVAKLAKKYNKKVIAIVGCLDKGYETVYEHGIDAVFDITPINSSFDELKKESKKNLELTSFNIAKCLELDLKTIDSFSN